MGISMTDRNNIFISISNTEAFRGAFSDYELVLDQNNVPVHISDEDSSADVYSIRKSDDEAEYIIKVYGLKESLRKSDGGHDFSNEIKRAVRLQNTLSYRSKNIIPIEAFRIFALKFDENGEFSDCINVDVAEENSRIVIFLIMRKYKPVVEKKMGSDECVCRIPLLNAGGEAEGLAGEKKGVLFLAYDLADALNTIHIYHGADQEKGTFSHGNISLSNIFYDEETKRFMLGTSLFPGLNESNSVASGKAGGFTAPEINYDGNEENAAFDAQKADIYSYGMVLYVLLNALAFPGEPEGSLLDKDKRFFPNIEKNSIPPKNGFSSINSLILCMINFDPVRRQVNSENILSEIKAIFDDAFPGEIKKLQVSKSRLRPRLSYDDVNSEDGYVPLPAENKSSYDEPETKPKKKKKDDSDEPDDAKSFRKMQEGISKARPYIIFPIIVFLPMLFYVETYYSMPADFDGAYFLSLLFCSLPGIFYAVDYTHPKTKISVIFRTISYLSLIPACIFLVNSIRKDGAIGPNILLIISLVLAVFYLGGYSLLINISLFIYYLAVQCEWGIINIPHDLPIWIMVMLMLVLAMAFSSFYEVVTMRDFSRTELIFIIFGIALLIAGIIFYVFNTYLSPIPDVLADLHFIYLGLSLTISSILIALCTQIVDDMI